MAQGDLGRLASCANFTVLTLPADFAAPAISVSFCKDFKEINYGIRIFHSTLLRWFTHVGLWSRRNPLFHGQGA